ncbi:FixH family protein [Streptomyces sp. NBC_01304]|nr:FixH family protein [Streptomyces sp. NBC_01304]
MLPPPADPAPEFPVAPLPTSADCAADTAGGLTFDLADPGLPGAAHLRLHRRESGQEVRLPLTPAGDGRLRAVLPSSVALPEGRWDVYAEQADGSSERLVPGLNDLRALVDRAPGEARDHVAVRIPYATKHGNLTVRAWHRAPHAEAGELCIEEAALTVRGRVYGAALTAGAYAEARSRKEAGLARRAELTAEGAEFAFTVDYAALAAQGGTWDLWLRPAGEQGPEVRVARLLDDVVDKKPIFTYPAAVLVGQDGPVQAGPYYTMDNDLSVQIAEVPEA